MIAARNVLTEHSIGGATTKHAYWGLEVAVEKLVWSTFILYKMVQGCGWVSDIKKMVQGCGWVSLTSSEVL